MIWKTTKQLKLLFFAGFFAVIGFLLWSIFSAITPHPLKVFFFDAGQGDAILIRTEDGQNVLIDGGPDRSIIYKLEKVLPWYDRTIDVVILTHPHADHVAGLIEVAKRYNIGRVISTGAVHTTPEYLEWLDLLKKKKKTLDVFKQADTLTLDHGVILTALAPVRSLAGERVEDLNNTSLVFLLQTPSSRVLLMGDAEELVEKQILATHQSLAQQIDILKVGHHGSRNGTTKEFLDVVRPRYAVISAGRKNRFGHPHLETLARLREAGTEIFRTDQNGDIVFTEKNNALQIVSRN